MNPTHISRAFEEGVKAALKFFQSPGGQKPLIEGAQAVMKNMAKVVKAANQVRK